MLTENKFSKYLIYAVGEIILVVIGILIALQINNWNENRINDKKEVVILEALKTEISENQTLLSSYVEQHAKVLKLLIELNAHISPQPQELSDVKLDSLIFGLGWLPYYTPKEGVINSTINSGKISLIKNNKLTSKLASWSSLLNAYNSVYKWTERDVFEQTLPYIQEKYPFKNTLHNFGVENKAISKFEYSKDALLSDLGFESLVSNRAINAQDILDVSQELYIFQNEVLQLIDSELEDK